MSARTWLVCGSLFAALDVALAAYGAHGLRETLDRIVPDAITVRETAQPGGASGMASTSDVRASSASARDAEIAKRLANFDTAVRYQMYHALALVALGLLAARQRSAWLSAAGWLFLAGIVLFSGLLYGLVFSGPKVLGAIVPLGGLALILAWVALAVGAWRIGNTSVAA